MEIKQLEQCKKALNCFDEYYVKEIEKSFNNFNNMSPEPGSEIPKIELFGENISNVIKGLLSGCYYFLDDNEIHISLSYNVGTNKYYYHINAELEQKEFNSRKECELHSITKAFNILEQKL